MNSLSMRRILLIDLHSVLPINVNLIGYQFVDFQLFALNTTTGQKKEISPLKSKSYKKESKIDKDLFSQILFQRLDVQKTKSSFRVPINFNVQKKSQELKTYIVWFFDESPEEHFDELHLQVSLVEKNNLKDEFSSLASQTYTFSFQKRLLCCYYPLLFFDDYFLKIESFVYCFVKGVNYSKELSDFLDQKKELTSMQELNSHSILSTLSLDVLQSFKESFRESIEGIQLLSDNNLQMITQNLTNLRKLKSTPLYGFFKEENLEEEKLELISTLAQKTFQMKSQVIPTFLDWI